MESLAKETNTEMTETVFLRCYENLSYKHEHKESVVDVLRSREMGSRAQCFYTRSLCAAKVESCVQPLVYPVDSVSQTTKGADKRIRPRQFEYHPCDPSLMAVGTLDGEVVVLNHESGNIVSNSSLDGGMNGILGLCWLKQQPSKLLVGSDNGSLRLYDINNVQTEVDKHGHSDSSTVIFDDFEQLTSVHINSTDDRCLASGYSKKVAVYDVCSGKRMQIFTDMHSEPINVAKFANHSPDMFVTSSFDRKVKMWDLRQKAVQPCYTASSSRGNVMVVFSPDDLYLLVSAVDNEVKQLLAVDGRLHTDFRINPTGSPHNYTRSYYMNGRDYIISGSCEEATIRVCCAQTGRRLKDVSLGDSRSGSSIFVQSLRSDPFRHFNMTVLAAYTRPKLKYEIIKVNLLSAGHCGDENPGGRSICSSIGKGG